MIQANELRIGNFLGFKIAKDDNYYRVVLIDGRTGKVELDKMTDLHQLNRVEPIHLTTKILQKSGYKNIFQTEVFIGPEYDEAAQNDWTEIVLNEGEYCMRIVHMHREKDIQIIHPLKYLHQLQNIYYVLTGDELKIEL